MGEIFRHLVSIYPEPGTSEYMGNGAQPQVSGRSPLKKLIIKLGHTTVPQSHEEEKIKATVLYCNLGTSFNLIFC